MLVNASAVEFRDERPGETMMLYLDMIGIVSRRRGATRARGFDCTASVYETSPLLRRLAAESDFSPMSPAALDRLLERLEARRLAREEERWRLDERRLELTEVADEAERALLGATPFTDLGAVAAARQRLDAAMYLLSLIPDGEVGGPDEEAEKLKLLDGLRGWRGRLGRERERIRGRLRRSNGAARTSTRARAAPGRRG